MKNLHNVEELFGGATAVPDEAPQRPALIGDCILWQGAKSNGYGSAWCPTRKRTMPAHRKAYMDHTGVELPSNIVVRHKCSNRSCINTDHLEEGSHLDNIRDKVRDGTQNRGENMYRSQLTDDEVRQIWLNEEGLSNTALAKKYGTTGHNVFQILTGRNWTHVTGGGDNRRNRRKMNRRSHGRLSDDMIRDIKRNPDKLTQAQLARRHSVSPTTVCHILKGFLFPDIQ